ncbi:MAG: O-antigen ligase family protein [Verrucomicrobiota bacterium]|nr:O-antigen ligase family protein [Verrucomicrobiota bacterium]
MDREQLDEWLEKGIFGLVVGLLCFGPLAMGAVREIDLIVLLGFTIAILLLWAIRLWVRQSYRTLWPPVAWTVVAFLIYAGFRYPEAPLEYEARQEILKIAIYGVLFFAIIDNLNRSEWLQYLLIILIFVGVLISFYAVYQYLTDSQKVWFYARPPVYRGRGSGTYICPNHLAGYLEMLLPVALSLTLTGRNKPIVRVLLGYAALVMAVGIAVTLSRGGWVSIAVSLLFFFGIMAFQRTYRIPSLILLSIMLALGIGFAVNSIRAQVRYKRAAETSPGQIRNDRQVYWQAAIAVWREHPWIGAGPSQYDSYWAKYRGIGEQYQLRPVWAHNDYLNTLADYGIAGLGLISMVLLITTWGVLRTWKYVKRGNDLTSKGSSRSAIVLGASLGLVAMAVHSVVDFNMHIPGNAMVAITLLAILACHLRHATERFWVNPGITGRVLATALFLLAGWVMTEQAILFTREAHYLRKSEQRGLESLEQLEWLQKAHQVMPTNPQTIYLIGRGYRLKAWAGLDGYELHAREAMRWFQKGIDLNPRDPYPLIGYGMCLDWLRRKEEAGYYFEKALQLDPRGYYARAHYGWHLFQLGEYAKAKYWFLHSTAVRVNNNPIAYSYIKLCEEKLAEQARQQAK